MSSSQVKNPFFLYTLHFSTHQTDNFLLTFVTIILLIDLEFYTIQWLSIIVIY
jgi:hypothetical protein